MAQGQIGSGLQQLNISGVEKEQASGLAQDIGSLFGSVAKGVETYNTIGETAAKLEFQTNSLDAQNAITELNKQAIGKENDPEFWMNYNKSIESITAGLASNSDKFKNHKAAYDVYNQSALDFSSSVRSKYIPYGEQKQFDATKTLVVANEENYLSSIGSNINNDIMQQSKERLQLVGYDRETATSWVEGKTYGSLFNSMDSAIALMPKSEIQNAITLEDGTLNKKSAVALFNMTASNSELTNAFVDKEGNIQIKNTSEDAKIKDDASKRMQMILSHWAKPTDAGYTNEDYGELKSKLQTHVVNHSNSPTAVIDAYAQREKDRAKFELTAGFKRLTPSEQETYKSDHNTDLALEQGYRKAVDLYNAGGIGMFSNLSETNQGQFVNLYGKKQDIVIKEEMIDSIKKFDEASTTIKVLNGEAGAIDENNRIMMLQGKELPVIKLTFSRIANGIPSPTFEAAKDSVSLLSSMYQQDTKSLTPAQIQWMNNSNMIIAKREQGIYKTDQEAKLALDQETKTSSITARGMNSVLDKSLQTAIKSFSENKIGANSQYKAGTASYVSSQIDKLGNDWTIMSDSEKANYVAQFVTTTQPSIYERGTTIDSYVVPRLKFKSGTYLEDATLHSGVDGYINVYNKQKKTNYGTDDFVFEASRNGNIQVTVRGVVVYPEMTAEKVQEFAKYKEAVSEKPSGRKAIVEKKTAAKKERIEEIKSLVKSPTKTISGAVQKAEKNIEENLGRLKKGLGF